MKNFSHLHLHTNFSLLDGSVRIDELFEYAKKLNQTSIAITDHGNLYGVIDFYKKAKLAGIKPIIGCEVYVAPISRFDKTNRKPFHLVLLAKNSKGYHNLMKLVTLSNIEGFYYKPRIDFELLQKYSDGLIALSACVYGEIPTLILSNEIQKAREIAIKYKNLFQDDFYLEVQNHHLESQKIVTQELVKFSKELNIPLVATNDVHYLKKEDAIAQDILLCIQTNSTLNAEKRMKFPNNEFYLKSYDEMLELFPECPEALETTQEIAEKCNLELEFGKLHLPKFSSKIDAFEQLKNLCEQGAKEKNIENSERLSYELEVIKNMGYVDYFLIVHDFINFARSKNIPVGPGRGSAAGSLVAYALNITDVDPIRFNLLFERFLNPERISMPDIDIDFCYHRRHEVIEYVAEKYGKKNVAQIITFGTLAAKAAIKDVGRVLELPYGTIDKLSKMVPNNLNITIDEALNENKELKRIYLDFPKIQNVIDIAKKIEGSPRHASTHAAGVVITEKELSEYVPLAQADNNLVAQFPMNTLEELGLLKMDFLGLKTLSVIREIMDNLKLDKNIFESLDDKSTFNLISSGLTDGVFQLESDGMKNFLRQLKPSNIEDIIAALALYRPGPMASIPKYISNKQNRQNIVYMHPKLKNILDVTYGCIVYQEQVMQIVQELAGFTLGQADVLRRAMSKKKKDVMEKEGKIFVEQCVKNGVERTIAKNIFAEMENFASYAFNKSHATAYAFLAYQTAYLKTHYPTEFAASLLTSEADNSSKLQKYIISAKKQGIEFLPCDVNLCYANFVTKDGKIHFGLAAVKGLGESFINEITGEREKNGEYKSFEDFCKRTLPLGLNKKTLEALIKCGSLDSFAFRSQMLAVYEDVLKNISTENRSNISGQISLFDTPETQNHQIEFPKIKEFPKSKLREMELEIFGFITN